MWELYDTLIEGMDETETMEEFLIGPRWSVVMSSSGSIGIAPVIREQYDRFDFRFRPSKGMPLKEAAAQIRSWNFMESSLALAAVNCFYNAPERSEAQSSDRMRVLPGGRRARKSFRIFCEENTAQGKTVLAEPIYNNDELADVPGRMDVLRRETEFRDYYISAYQERIPEADRLVLSGRTLMEKTAEPMLKTAAEHQVDVLLFGPDVPLCPELKKFGIRTIWGFHVDKGEKLMQLARAGMERDEFLKLGHFTVME